MIWRNGKISELGIGKDGKNFKHPWFQIPNSRPEINDSGKPRCSVAASDPAIGRLIEGLDNKIQVLITEH